MAIITIFSVCFASAGTLQSRAYRIRNTTDIRVDSVLPGYYTGSARNHKAQVDSHALRTRASLLSAFSVSSSVLQSTHSLLLALKSKASTSRTIKKFSGTQEGLASRGLRVRMSIDDTGDTRMVRSPRKISSTRTDVRLPVWPAWFGVVYILLELLGQKELAAKAEDLFGGRVCPMQLSSSSDPFLLVVHHRHSWFRFDPLRVLFRYLLPEGFPAHPHRGFETITYVLPGMKGLVHRDSMGTKMVYGDGDCQWMTAGRGMLHEEMWQNDRTDNFDKSLFLNSELYQIWLNLPARHKMTSPRIQLLRPQSQSDSSAPPPEVSVVDLPIASHIDGVTVRVLAGQFENTSSAVDTFSDVCILHATIDPGKTLEVPLPHAYTVMVYVRRGKSLVSSGKPVMLHDMTYFGRAGPSDGIRLTNTATDSKDISDILLLSGQPLCEPVANAGPFVMNTQEQLSQAYEDFSKGPLSRPWDHEYTDEQWQSHVASNY